MLHPDTRSHTAGTGNAGSSSPSLREGAADNGYDFPYLRQYLQRRGICSRIARRGIESRERLDRYRWGVERTFSWLHRMRRLRIRYERRTDIQQAFLQLGCVLIAWRHVQRFY